MHHLDTIKERSAWQRVRPSGGATSQRKYNKLREPPSLEKAWAAILKDLRAGRERRRDPDPSGVVPTKKYVTREFPATLTLQQYNKLADNAAWESYLISKAFEVFQTAAAWQPTATVNRAGQAVSRGKLHGVLPDFYKKMGVFSSLGRHPLPDRKPDDPLTFPQFWGIIDILRHEGLRGLAPTGDPSTNLRY